MTALAIMWLSVVVAFAGQRIETAIKDTKDARK